MTLNIKAYIVSSINYECGMCECYWKLKVAEETAIKDWEEQ